MIVTVMNRKKKTVTRFYTASVRTFTRKWVVMVRDSGVFLGFGAEELEMVPIPLFSCHSLLDSHFLLETEFHVALRMHGNEGKGEGTRVSGLSEHT